jgi:hypothetical protein
MNLPSIKNIKPFSKKQLTKRALQSENDIRKEKVTSLEKLKQEIKKW